MALAMRRSARSGRRDVRGRRPRVARTCRWIRHTRPSGSRTSLNTARPALALTTSADDFEVGGVAGGRRRRARPRRVRRRPVADAERRAPLRPDNTAYVIFTSGSTGQPEGCGGVAPGGGQPIAVEATADYGIGAGDVALLKTAATFDLSVWEYWSAAAPGAGSSWPMPTDTAIPAYLTELIRAERVTTAARRAVMLEALTLESGGTLAPSLRHAARDR